MHSNEDTHDLSVVAQVDLIGPEGLPRKHFKLRKTIQIRINQETELIMKHLPRGIPLLRG